MPKNFKKLLVCILATFGITAMVFSCCKKVGLCASDSSNPIVFNPPPYLWGDGIGSYDSSNLSMYLNMVDYAISDYSSYVPGTTVVVLPYNSKYYVVILSNTTISVPSDFTNLIKFNYYVSYEFNSSGSYSSKFYSGQIDFRPVNVVETLNNNTYYKGSSADGYPVFVYNQENFKFSNDIQVFTDEIVPIGPDGHSKGGVLSNYIDSDDLIEDSSDLPKVDTSAPSNSSSIPEWLQKILNGIGRVNQSIQGGVLTIGDYIGSLAEKIGEWFQNTIDSIEGFFGRVVDKLDDIIDSIEGLLDGTTVSQARDVWIDEFENSIFQDFVDLKSTIDDDILTPIKNVNAPSTLSFTIPLIKVNVPNLINSGGQISTSTNNVYLFGQSVIFDFSWYTRSISGGVFNGSSIRDFIVPIIASFLYVGMVVSLLFKIPSFLSGSSGFANIMHSVSGHNGSHFMPTSNGVFTSGVSHLQPSLDKSPISGGSFRFWNY